MFKKVQVFILVLSIIILGSVTMPSIANATQQRYMIYPACWNWTCLENTFTTFKTGVDTAKAVGFNAIKVHIPWSVVVSRSNVTDWTLMDQQVDYVVNTLKLPVCILIDLTRYSSDGNDAVLDTSELQKNAAGDYSIRVDFGPPGDPKIGNMNCIAFASDSALAKANSFISTVTNRYNSRYAAGSVLHYQVTMTQYAEAEYWINETQDILDYSDAAITKFRAWLPTKYSDINALNKDWGTGYASFSAVSAPTSFSGNSGYTWLQFRHVILKNALDSFGNTIHAVGASLKNCIQFGSTFDAYVDNRGTAVFPDLCSSADIVMNDDTPYFNHNFSMDVLRGSLPGKWIGNECSWPGLVPSNQVYSLYYAQVSQSFDHGATLVTFGNWTAADLLTYQTLFTDIKNNYLSGSVSTGPASHRMNMDAYYALRNGNSFYQTVYNAISNNGQYWIDVALQDNITVKSSLGAIKVNNAASANLVYSGAGWVYDPNRAGTGDFKNDENYTSALDDYFQYTFNGTGIEWFCEKDIHGGNTDIYIDDVYQTTVSAYSSTYLAQQVIYSNKNLTPGTHTIKGVKKTGNYLEVDGFKVYSNSNVFNDTSSPEGIIYNGTWTYDPYRTSVGDWWGDEHYTPVQNDYFEFTFEGTGVSFFGDKDTNGGDIEIYIDNVLQATVSAYNTYRMAQQTIYDKTGLTSGEHTFKAIKKSGNYMQVDGIIVHP